MVELQTADATCNQQQLSTVSRNASKRVLIVDDEPAIRLVIRSTLRDLSAELLDACNGDECLKQLHENQIDVVLLDIHLPGVTGIDLLKSIRAVDSKVPVVFVTGESSSHSMIKAMQAGAFDYVRKPIDREQIRQIVSSAVSSRESMDMPVALPLAPSDDDASVFVGVSDQMTEVFKRIGRVANEDITVLITGESGTGKEMVARAIVSHSDRSDKPFAAINCAAFPEHLLESELFGHEVGSFTGAGSRRIGRFEQCDGGTILLDEIGDMPIGLQSKILRLMQQQRFERVGGNHTVETNVRIIAATNQPLAQMVKNGRFREDLLYRINDFVIHVPPLRERPDDIPVLIRHFLLRAVYEMGRTNLEGLSAEALFKLKRYPWPGNIRELQSTIRQCVINTPGTVIDTESLPVHICNRESKLANTENSLRSEIEGLATLIEEKICAEECDLFYKAQLELEAIMLRHALKQVKGNISLAAKMLGLTRNTVRKHAKELRISF